MDVSTAQALKAQLADLMAQLTVLSNKVVVKSFNDMSLAEKIEYVNAQNGKSIEITDFSFINAEFCQNINENAVFNGKPFTDAIIDEILKQNNAKKGSLAHNLISAINEITVEHYYNIYTNQSLNFLMDVVVEFPKLNGQKAIAMVCGSHTVSEAVDVCCEILKNSHYTVKGLIMCLRREELFACSTLFASKFIKDVNDMDTNEKCEYILDCVKQGKQITDFSFIDKAVCDGLPSNATINGLHFIDAIINEIVKASDAKEGTMANKLMNLMISLNDERIYTIYERANVELTISLMAEFPQLTNPKMFIELMQHSDDENIFLCRELVKNSQYTVIDVVSKLYSLTAFNTASKLAHNAFPELLFIIISQFPQLIEDHTFKAICAGSDCLTVKKAYTFFKENHPQKIGNEKELLEIIINKSLANC